MWEAPFWNVLVLYGHCQNSFPPLPLLNNALMETTHFKKGLPLPSILNQPTSGPTSWCLRATRPTKHQATERPPTRNFKWEDTPHKWGQTYRRFRQIYRQRQKTKDKRQKTKTSRMRGHTSQVRRDIQQNQISGIGPIGMENTKTKILSWRDTLPKKIKDKNKYEDTKPEFVWNWYF